MPRSIPPLHKKDQHKPKPPPQPIQRPRPAAKKPVAELFRFPTGTQVFANYHGAKEKWLIQLIVPGEGLREIEADGIHWGIRQLGKAWNEERKRKEAASAATASPDRSVA